MMNEIKRNRFRKSDWLPALLLAYFVCMGIWFGKDLAAAGEWIRLIVVSVVELGVIFLLRRFLRRREQNRK